MKINPKIKIVDLIETYPDILGVFATNGFQANSKEELLAQVGPDLQLQSALKAKRINQKLFLEMLEDQIEESLKKPLVPTEVPPEGKLDFLVYIVCPLKHLFKDGLEKVLEDYRQKTGKTYNCFVPMGCGGADPYEDIWKVDSIDDFSGSSGFSGI